MGGMADGVYQFVAVIHVGQLICSLLIFRATGINAYCILQMRFVFYLNPKCRPMKTKLAQKFISYLYNNFLGNFLGFLVGIASTRIVSQFFATRSIKNLWGLTSKKTVVDKQTFGLIEATASIIIGFIVFELISKAVKRKMEQLSPSWKKAFKDWFSKFKPLTAPTAVISYNEANANNEPKKVRIYRDVQ